MEPVTGAIREVAQSIGEAVVQTATPTVKAGIETIAAGAPSVGTEAARTVGEIATTARTIVKEGTEAAVSPLENTTGIVSGVDATTNSQIVETKLPDTNTAGQNSVGETGILQLNRTPQNLEPNSLGVDTNQTPATEKNVDSQTINKIIETEVDWKNLTTDQKIDHIWEKLNNTGDKQEMKALLKMLGEVKREEENEARKRGKENEALRRQNEELLEKQKILEAQQKESTLILADIDEKTSLKK